VRWKIEVMVIAHLSWVNAKQLSPNIEKGKQGR
jgi:hypothetical protein